MFLSNDLLVIQECHLLDIMEAAEPDKGKKSFTQALPSKIIKLAFFGMFRKPMSTPLETFLIRKMLLKV
jgi:hypothetical protein